MQRRWLHRLRVMLPAWQWAAMRELSHRSRATNGSSGAPSQQARGTGVGRRWHSSRAGQSSSAKLGGKVAHPTEQKLDLDAWLSESNSMVPYLHALGPARPILTGPDDDIENAGEVVASPASAH